MANGAFAVSAIGAMMGLAGPGEGAGSRSGREGVRMGLWGAAQAIAFAMGGLVAGGASDLARSVLGSPRAAYGIVFIGEAVLFAVAARLAHSVFQPLSGRRPAAAEIIGSTFILETSRGRAA